MLTSVAYRWRQHEFVRKGVVGRSERELTVVPRTNKMLRIYGVKRVRWAV